MSYLPRVDAGFAWLYCHRAFVIAFKLLSPLGFLALNIKITLNTVGQVEYLFSIG